MPQPVGYSGKPLWQKLGLAGGQRLLLVTPPPHVDDLLDGAPKDVTRLPRIAEFDVALAFVHSRRELAAVLTELLPKLATSGMIWIAWPKKASGIVTDVSEDIVREIALPMGIVDVKVCAIDATWSGLKVVRRRLKR